MEQGFTDKDISNAVEYLNFVATHAEFNKLSVKSLLSFTKLLHWAQTELLPKMEAHKFQIKSFTPAPEPEAKKKSTKKVK